MTAIGDSFRKINGKIFAFFFSTLGKQLIKLVLSTCKWEVHGLENFTTFASKNKCILMLWHNRLAITSFILYRYAKQFSYTAFVSNSRDGELIDMLVNSYSMGKTIKVPHQSRHEALRTLIKCINSSNEIAIITPDGPRGPKYEVKPGIALAALKTNVSIVPLTWEADHYWELNTWDKLRLPKPFSTIKVSFNQPIQFSKDSSLEEIQSILQSTLPSE